MENPKIKNLLDRAWRDYNPENDIPHGVQVTFTDSCLLEICQEQQAYIEGLQIQVDDLKRRISQMENE